MNPILTLLLVWGAAFNFHYAAAEPPTVFQVDKDIDFYEEEI